MLENILESDIFSFFVLICLIYIVYREVRIFIGGYKTFKSSKKEKLPVVHMICSIDFFRSLIFGCDSVLGVLITKALLENSSIPLNGLTLSIPMTLFGIGSILCLPFFQLMSYKISIKKFYYICFIGLFISLLLLIFSVKFNNFIFYCIAKFIFGFSIILYLTTNHTIPMCVKNEKIRFKAFRGFSMTDISGTILSIVVCSEIADFFGPQDIYLFALILSIIGFVLILRFVNKKQNFPAKKDSKIKDIKNVIKIFISLPMIACLLVSFISYTTGIYKTFVFPLMGDEYELSQQAISYVTSLSLIAVYLISRLYDKITKHIEHWNLTILGLTIIGIVFTLFILFDSLLWAIITLVVSGIVYKSLFVETRMLSPRYCRYKNIEPSKVQPIFDFIDSISCTLRTPLLGAFMFVGPIGPCIGLGLMSFICLIVFVIFTYKSPIRKN